LITADRNQRVPQRTAAAAKNDRGSQIEPFKRAVRHHEMRHLISILFVLCVLGGCRSYSSRTLSPNATRPQSTPAAVSADDAKVAFDSPEALTKLLERRWPVAAIQTYCIPERRHNNAYQNLVAYSPRWEGILYRDTSTGFDRITWYASTKHGRADEYSLEAYRGKDFWLLEICSEESIQKPPNYSPDPHEPWFIGHR
jgi:hypothetical protein